MIFAANSTTQTVFITDVDPDDDSRTVTYMMYGDEDVWESLHTPLRTMEEVRAWHASWNDDILHDGDLPCV